MCSSPSQSSLNPTLGNLLRMANLDSLYPTFALTRDSTFSGPFKSRKLQSLTDLGAFLHKGSLEEEESLFKVVKQVDMVISVISSKQAPPHKIVIRSIKRNSSIKVSSPYP